MAGGTPDSPWDIIGDLYIGNYGDGTLNIVNGGAVTAGHSYIGIGFFVGAYGSGTVTIDGAGSSWTSVGFDVNNGSVSVTNGGALVSAMSTVGLQSGSHGFVSVDGPGSSWNSQELHVGESGNGQLLIEGGGTVNSSDFGIIGNLASAQGKVVVDGIGSAWYNDGNTFVGEYGSGTLNIKNGGVVVNNEAAVGNLEGSNGIVSVEGNGSSWTNNGRLTIGNSSIGQMTIGDGGKVTNSDGFIGRFSGSVGSVYVTGENSKWSNSGVLSVGRAGTAELTINEGGTVSASSIEIGGSTGGLGTVNIGGDVGVASKAAGLLDTETIKFGQGTGILNFNTTNEFTLAAAISGKGTINEIAGKTILTGDNSGFTGTTNVTGGTLVQGAAGSLSSGSDHFVGTSGVLDVGGFDTTIASLTNGGTVMFGGTGGAVLRVAGNYTADSGTLVINTVLGDDNSKTDMLQVDGSTSGSGKIYVQNQGGTGAQTINGIKIVNVDGNSDGKFTLANSYTTKDGQQAVVGGAYAYTLQKGGDKTPTDGEWYLVSHMPDPVNPVDPDCAQTNSCPPAPPAPPAPRYSAGAPVYEGYVQNMLTLNKLPTLQQRVGNRYFTGGKLQGSDDAGQPDGASVNEYGVWGRVEGSHNRLEPSTSTARMKQDINALQMQAGIDGHFYESEQGRLIAGITGQYGHAKGDISSLYGDGSIGTDAWSLGATATWYGNDGFYLDTQGQVTWFNSDLDSWTANQGLADGRKATGYAMSAEAGKRIAIGGNWSLTPQAQLAWSSIHADAFRDVWDARVSVDDGSSLLGRLGLAAEYGTQWKDESGRTTQANIYGIANLYQEFLSSTTVKLAGVDFNTDNDRTWAGVGGGGTFTWNDNKYALYGEGSINTAVNHFADSYTLKGNVGFRVNW
ncbi:autotransporter outer membrane beta-barrel domain-containing protein [Ochrobactrum sp. AN78]|uniref:autotransporter family protein n=1 Tax=Ochrobactrum sp. AN78 TaxID=3039853 RepID=UPI00298A052F|nr:autotransporter outer membrane beta-barrel domain-containing protein [Ochrobactrum sp. AN78]